MPLNQQALATLTPQQQQIVQQALGISRAQRQQRGFMDEWKAYQSAVQSLAGGGAATTPTTPTTPTTTVRSTGVVMGNPRALYKSMGGKSGTQMSFREFRKWYETQTSQAGMDLSQYMEMAGLTAGNLGTGKNADWEAMTGPGATVVGAGTDITGRADLSTGRLSDEGELFWINKINNTNYATLEEAKQAMALPSGMAGVEQFRQNVSGEGGEKLPPHLRNVSAQDIRYDPTAWNLVFGGARDAPDAAARLAAQQELVPEWAAEVDKALQAQGNIPGREDQTGIPFGFELMMDPNVNISDPSKPLWEGAYPPSLMALHQNQAGEGAFLKGLSMQEVMQSLWPLVYSQHHRPAGAPAPFEAGLSFGSPAGTIRSPMMGYSHRFGVDPEAMALWGDEPGTYGPSDISRIAGPGGWAGGLYNRWSAFGQPGTTDWDAQTYGPTLMGGNPDFQPSDFGYNDAQVAANPRLAAMIEMMLARQEQDYWQIPYYAPWRNLPPEVLARLQALIGSPVGPGGETTLTAGYE